MSTARKRQGFTLIEVLLVVLVVSLLSGIVLSQVGGSREKTTVAAGKQFDSSLYHTFGPDAVAVWDFNEGSGTTVYDASGEGNHLTFSGTVGWLTGGVKGSALNFSGAPSYLQNTNFKGLNLSTTGSGSISFWIQKKSNYSPNSGNYDTIFSTSNNSLIIWTTPSQFIYLWMNGSTPVSFSFGVNPSQYIGKWTHVVVSWSGANVKLYLNGKLHGAEFNSRAGQTFASCAVQIGYQASNPPAVRYLWAYLDEFRVYTLSLQSAEVEQLYADGAVRHGIAVK